jgi:hypothetical protein
MIYMIQIYNRLLIFLIIYFAKFIQKLRDFSPQANYTYRTTAACRRSLVPTSADRGCRVVSATNPHCC